MKIVIKWSLFLVFINIFIPMIAGLGFFPAQIEGDTNYYNINNQDNIPSDTEGFQRSTGYSFTSFTDLDLESFGILGFGLIFGIALVKMTHSLMPLIVSLFVATFINIYRRSTGFINQFNVNPYIIYALCVMFLLMIIITVFEYFAHGDVSDN